MIKFTYALSHQDSRAVKRLVRRFGTRKRILMALMPRCPNIKLLQSNHKTLWVPRALLARKCKNYKFQIPYEESYYHKNDSLLKLLLICGCTCDYETIFMLLARKHFTLLSTLFACHVDINQRDEEDFTLLERHLFNDENIYKCKFLLDCGADPNLRKDGKTARYQAINDCNDSDYNRKIIHLLDTYSS